MARSLIGRSGGSGAPEEPEDGLAVQELPDGPQPLHAPGQDEDTVQDRIAGPPAEEIPDDHEPPDATEPGVRPLDADTRPLPRLGSTTFDEAFTDAPKGLEDEVPTLKFGKMETPAGAPRSTPAPAPEPSDPGTRTPDLPETLAAIVPMLQGLRREVRDMRRATPAPVPAPPLPPPPPTPAPPQGLPAWVGFVVGGSTGLAAGFAVGLLLGVLLT